MKSYFLRYMRTIKFRLTRNTVDSNKSINFTAQFFLLK